MRGGSDTVDVGAVAGVVVIRLCGDLDASTAADVRSALSSVAGRRCIVDLDRVTFTDSAGLGAIIGGIRRSRESGGRVALRCGPGSTHRLLRTSGVERLVPVRALIEDVYEALASAG
jgi:anti-sigma B factor antagonist